MEIPNINDIIATAKLYKKCKMAECGKVDVKSKFHGNVCRKCFYESNKPNLRRWYELNAAQLKEKRDNQKAIKNPEV